MARRSRGARSGGGAGVWRIGGASVRGAAHARAGKGNEDAIVFGFSADARRIVAAVSDGHGAAAHCRSAVGAALAVQAARRVLDRGGRIGLPDEILALWRRLVADHAVRRPLTAREVVLSHGELGRVYGATLVAARIEDDRISMLQIGDGDLLTGFADGRLERPLRRDEGLRGGQTYSLCLDGALDHFRSHELHRDRDGPWPDFLLIASDGVSNSFADEPGFRRTAARLRRLAMENWEALIAELPAWLGALSAIGSGDDSSLCLAVRLPAPSEG